MHRLEPAIVVGGARVFLGDCRDVLKTLPDNSVDSVVTDPPYGLNFMGKEWDNPGKMLGQMATGHEQRGAYAYGGSHSRGYADNNSLGFQLWCTEWAVECLRVLKPGGHILAFGGSRTWHRLAVAVEDAGFELRDSIAWIYGSGFPKSLDVSKAIDKSDAKVERRARDLRFTAWMRSTGMTAKQINELTDSNMGGHYLTEREQPTVPTEDMFAMLRPHLPKVPEDIERLVFERTVESKNFAEREVIGQQRQGRLAVAPGQGEDRSAIDLDITLAKTPEAQKWQGWGTALKPAFEPIVVGRKPLVGTVAENVLLWGVGGLNIDGSRIGSEKRVNQPASSLGNAHTLSGGKAQTDLTPNQVQGRWPANVVLDEFTAGLLDEQSGVSKSSPHLRISQKSDSQSMENPLGAHTGIGVSDSGGASRFFYLAKASKRDRNEGLEDLDAKGSGAFDDDGHRKPGERKNNHTAPMPKQNFHPTVKPTQLMRYLIKLVTPEGGTVLDPFTGSGSTGKAALLDGYDFIGAELTEEYLPIIEGRLRWAHEQGDDDDTLF